MGRGEAVAEVISDMLEIPVGHPGETSAEPTGQQVRSPGGTSGTQTKASESSAHK